MKLKKFQKVAGSTPEEKFGTLGIKSGDSVDFRVLKKLDEQYDIDVILYFEQGIARKSTYDEDLKNYLTVSEYERPFIKISKFLNFVSESDPDFIPRLDQFPIMVEIITVDEYDDKEHGIKVPYIKCLLPFYDELDEWSAE